MSPSLCTSHAVLWFCARSGADVRDAVRNVHPEVRWTETTDAHTALALGERGLCDIVVVHADTPSASDVVRSLRGTHRVIWSGDDAPARTWLHLHGHANTSSLIHALTYAIVDVSRAATLASPITSKAPPTLVGRSYAIRQLQRALPRVAGSKESVLISGQPGTGKRLIAQHLHHMGRAGEPLTHIACSEPDEAVLDALLGEDGALYQRCRGTVVLHDVHHLGPRTQGRLCTWMTRKPTARRIIALGTEATSGSLREDLFFRLATLHLRIPALSERPEDLAPLLDRFIDDLGSIGISTEARHQLEHQDWPRNAIDVRQVLTKAHLASAGQTIDVHHLPRSVRVHGGPAPSLSHDRTLADLERRTITSALRRLDGNVTEVGRELGISRSTLYRKLRSYGLR